MLFEKNNSAEIQAKNKISRENAQLHLLCENLSRVLKKHIDDPNMKYFWSFEDRQALEAYEKFKDEAIWGK